MGWMTDEDGRHIYIADADVEVNFYNGKFCKIYFQPEEFKAVEKEIHNWYKSRFLTRLTKTKKYKESKPEKYCSISIGASNCIYFFKNYGYDKFTIIGRLRLDNNNSYEIAETVTKVMKFIEKKGGNV